MKLLDRFIKNIDNYQQRHTVPSFLYAIIKKYGQDNGSYQSAIITYYGLLSLFPLLIVFTSFTQLILKNDARLRARLSLSASHYFPVIGGQLQKTVHDPRGTGVVLVISLLITLYGARGVASALQYTISNLWKVPIVKQPPFLKNISRSLGIILIGGLGFIIAATFSSYTASLSHNIIIKILTVLLSALILWATFIFVFKLAIAGRKSVQDVIVGAAIAAVGIQVLQSVGGLILKHELKSLNSDYGTFALVIGLLFWIYLQAQVILYAIEVDVIRKYHLFPRSITNDITDYDKLTYKKNAKANKQHVDEKIKVDF
jgi:membrane protein